MKIRYKFKLKKDKEGKEGIGTCLMDMARFSCDKNGLNILFGSLFLELNRVALVLT